MAEKAVKQSMTKTEFAFEHLRQAIYSGTLMPGQRLPVSDLMKLLDISPTPIREALRLLQSSGLVVHESHRGMVVRSKVDHDDPETHELRMALEPLAARRAAKTGTDAELSQIGALYKRVRSIASGQARKDSLTKIRMAHDALFEAIIAAAHYPMLADFVRKLRVHARETRPLHQWEETLDEQERIVTAIVARDEAFAESAMRDYLLHVHLLADQLAERMSRGEAN